MQVPVRLTRSRNGAGELVVRLEVPLLDVYLEFLAGNLPEHGLEHGVGETGIVLSGRPRQQRLNGADSRCLDEVDGALLTDAEPPGYRDPVNPRLQNMPARLRCGRVQHPSRVGARPNHA
jgi:hypothetical protein